MQIEFAGAGGKTAALTDERDFTILLTEPKVPANRETFGVGSRVDATEAEHHALSVRGVLSTSAAVTP